MAVDQDQQQPKADRESQTKVQGSDQERRGEGIAIRSGPNKIGLTGGFGSKADKVPLFGQKSIGRLAIPCRSKASASRVRNRAPLPRRGQQHAV